MSRPLRIHFFVHFVHEQGTYFRFNNLARALIGAGEQVTIYGTDGDRRSKSRSELRDGVPYVIVPSAPGSRFASPVNNPVNFLRRGLVAGPPCDIAHLFQPFASALLAWRRCPAKVRFYDWDDLWEGGFWSGAPHSLRDRFDRRVTGTLERKLPQWADHTTTCGAFLTNLARANGAENVSVVHNGIWSAPKIHRTEARKIIGLQADALYVGFMGRTCDELDWCVEALAQNMNHYPALRFAVCGAPTDVFAKVPSHIAARIDHLGLLPSGVVRNFAAALDIGLLPLERNPFNESRFPIKLAEYLGAGTPVLCSQVGEVATLTERLDGVINAGTDKAEWMTAFASALQAAAVNTLPMPQAADIQALFSWAHIGAKLAKIYRQRLAAKPE